MDGPSELPLVGWREWATFPELGLPPVKAKIDTGARSSSLHAIHITPFRRGGADWVRFEVHPEQRSATLTIQCEAPLLERRPVKSSNGAREARYFIETHAEVGPVRWPIELSLTSRAEMGFRLLLGRQAVRGRFLVDPGRSFLMGRLRRRKKTKRPVRPNEGTTR